MTDRYNAAITDLGSHSIDVRLGGIYALQRIMQDSPRDQPTIVAVLCAFVRDHASANAGRPSSAISSGSTAEPPTDIQAALTVVGTRNSGHDGADTVIDLNHTDLAGADLSDADLANANFSGADLNGAKFASYTPGSGFIGDPKYLTKKANLTHSNLTNADLAKANLSSVVLKWADLSNTNFTDAELGSAKLTDSSLSDTNFTRADLNGADLSQGPDLEQGWIVIPSTAPLAHPAAPYIDFSYADLTDVNLHGVETESSDFSGASFSSHVPPPRGWVLNTSTGRLEKVNR